jgi:SAM-dependent MidA family methyltransferase
MSALPRSIRERIQAEGGSVPFARFMELALTDPDAGYYARGVRFLGEKGDFTTAPRRVPAFSRAIARFLADLIDVIPTGLVTVVEVGAGEGDLGAGVLEWWATTRPDLRDRVTYLVDDVAEASRRRQAAALGAAAAGGWRVGIRGENPREGGPVAAAERGPSADPGVDTAVATATGIVVTNELFDALPVHVVDVRGKTPMEAWVEVETGPGDHSVVEAWKELSPEAARELEVIASGCAIEELRAFTVGGFLELRPAAGALLDRWSGWYEDLAVLTIDYGDWLAGPTAEIPPPAPRDPSGATRLRADLHRRSLRGYYRHHVTRDPYQYVGRQDLTADVDFRALALHGEARGFETVLFTTLAAFLHTAGAREEVRPESKGGEGYTLQADMDDAPLVGLLDADGLGGLFKVMLQVKEKDGS